MALWARWLVIWSLAMQSLASDRVHIVVSGDSLSRLAERYGVSVGELVAWNHLEADAIQIGQVLTVSPPGEVETTRVIHRVRSGESLGRIARRSGTTVHALVALNPGIDPDRVREGAEIVIAAGPLSASIGRPMGGAIEGAVQLRPHPAFVLRNLERAYATRTTVERILGGFDALRRAEPRAPRVRVHDLSLPFGGPIDDHRTHQSGRDVDITYYQRHGCGEEGCPLRAVEPDELDARRQWRLLSHWIRRGEIEVVYVDHALQEPLYREARRAGATRAQLSRWFQYPRDRSVEAGLVRHYPNHRDHVHVRFACHSSEPRCERAVDSE